MHFRDAQDNDMQRIVVDSFWIIILGKFGLCGWACWTCILVLPGIVAAIRSEIWLEKREFPIMVLSLSSAIFAIDCMLNAMVNPVLVMLSGAVVGLLQNGLGDEFGTAGYIRAGRPVLSQNRRVMWPRPEHTKEL